MFGARRSGGDEHVLFAIGGGVVNGCVAALGDECMGWCGKGGLGGDPFFNFAGTNSSPAGGDIIIAWVVGYSFRGEFPWLRECVIRLADQVGIGSELCCAV
jgi:hypothetical protein